MKKDIKKIEELEDEVLVTIDSPLLDMATQAREFIIQEARTLKSKTFAENVAYGIMIAAFEAETIALKKVLETKK